ncbi:MAG: hypothetical protein IT308_08115 [Anaerolineaceae bacterium]|nr:hypothetical protein [Anaerolineaceae bacterium]
MSKVFAPFVPAQSDPLHYPLERFLPPLPVGMIKSWLRAHLPIGSWVIDPIGSTPAVPLEAAQAGYRILVASNNPILSFMLEILAAAPKKTDFLAALAELGSSRRGDERLEQYFQEMYRTTCSNCGQDIQPSAYLWRREEKTPFARFYHCPHCGDQGERKITESDIRRLDLIGKDALHRSRAIERIRVGTDPVEPAAEEAIQAYLPRPLDFLFTVINRLEGLPLTIERRNLLTALVLSACDEGSALWNWPNARSRPKQLNIPPQFRENNLWLAFEDAITSWTAQTIPLPLTHWPQLPPEAGGICLFPGRLKSLEALPSGMDLRAAVAALPRPNQAFWTLCAVWSGWIWGKEAVLPLRKALERRRYDWNWHTTALHNSFTALYQRVPANLPFFGVLTELVPGFLTASIASADSAGFQLKALSLLEDEETAQIHWRSLSFLPPQRPQKEGLEPFYKKSITVELQERNQPADYLSLLAVSLGELSQADLLPGFRSQIESNLSSRLQQPFERLLNDNEFLIHYHGQLQSTEAGSWWLRNPPPAENPPLLDQVEVEVVRLLQKNKVISEREIQSVLYPLFPGVRTPPTALIQLCLESYAEPSPDSPCGWQLRPTEFAARRRSDIQEMASIIQNLARRFGLTCQGEEALEWRNEAGEVTFRFEVFASSIISRYILTLRPEKETPHILVLPGSRSSLLAYKLQRDPRLAAAVQTGWYFLKFRHLRQIGERETLTHSDFLNLLSQDPPLGDEPKQMTFL